MFILIHHHPTPNLMTWQSVPLPNPPRNLEIPEPPNLMYIIMMMYMTLLFILAVQGQATAERQNLPQLVAAAVEANTDLRVKNVQ